MKYRKKPVIVEARQWDGTASGATPIINWILENDGTATYACNAPGGCDSEDEEDHHLAIQTLEGVMAALPGDWIIRGVSDEFYPCKDSIFRQTYEEVEG